MNTTTRFAYFWVLTIGLFWDIKAVAEPVSFNQAEKCAIEFISSEKRMISRTGRQLNLAFTIQRENKMYGKELPMVYAFNISNDGGIIFVSGDDVAKPILGYVEKGNIGLGEIPENMRFWLERYANEIAWAQVSHYQVSGKRNTSSKTDIPYMVKTTWDQSNPYWNQCLFDSTYCYTGCVATAMAQVMYYWGVTGRKDMRFQHGCEALPHYTTDTKHYFVEALDSMETFDWKNMPEGVPTTTEEISAVAQLMRYCGQSVYMDYTDNGSGAYTDKIADAFINYFGYNSTVKIVSRDKMTDTEWDNLIYAEMAAGRPVCMGGADVEENIGHEFICDGYQSSTDMYHINWGWSGFCNTYFALDALEPGGTGSGGTENDYGRYNDKCDAVIGIEPPTDIGDYQNIERCTFDATKDLGIYDNSSSGEDHVTKNGITISVLPKGKFGIGTEYRVFKGSDFTMTSTIGKIKKVVFICTATENTQYGPGCFSNPTTGNYTYEGKIGTWTGRSDQFTMTASDNQVRITKIIVYLEKNSLLGDVNNDGIVDISDVLMLVDYILGKNPEGFMIFNADVNQDEQIDISDVLNMVNIILGK